jgi:hypothetical protein
MNVETLKVHEVKADDGGQAVNVLVSQKPLKIVTLVFKSASRQQTNEIVRALESAKLTEITVTTS